MAKKDKKIKKAYHLYAESVLNGGIIACKWVKLACKRYLNDRKHEAKSDYYFSEDAADLAIQFFRICPHVKGEWAGQTIILEPWQEFIIANIFGWKRRIDDMRRFRTVYLEVARKNSKSTMLAVIGLYLTEFDNEAGSEVYSAATTRDQAKLVFNIAKQMVHKSRLKEVLIPFQHNIHSDVSGSKFEPLASDYNSLDGLNIHGGIIDELHAHKTGDLYDVIDTATGSRRQPLIVSITTAGSDKHSICWQQHDYTEKVLEGLIEDDRHFGVIYTVDEGDNWQDESVWIKANPNLNVSVKIDDLRQKALKAKEMPSQLNSFLRKHLDIWTESLTRWIPSETWDKCGSKVKELELKGRTGYGGLDLSSTRDITAWVVVFPPDREGEPYIILPRFFIPEDNIADRVRRDRVPYDVWVRQGYIQTTPGNVLDYGFILHQIDEDAQTFDLMELAFDRWGATKVVQDLQEMGFDNPKDNKHANRKLIDFGQGYASMSPPTKELEKLVLSQDIAHGNNPVLAWMMSNVVIREDPAGNIKVDKGKSTERVDGVVATIMALDRALRNEGESSVYETQGIMTL